MNLRICVDVKKQIDQHIRDNQRISNDDIACALSVCIRKKHCKNAEPKTFSSDGIKKLVYRLTKQFEKQDDYVQK